MITSCSNETGKSSQTTTQKRFENHIDSVSYAIGLDVAMRLEEQFKDIDHDMLSQAINDFRTGKELFLSDKGWLKILISCATGKKTHDKRQDLKLKDDRREMDRVMKRNR